MAEFIADPFAPAPPSIPPMRVAADTMRANARMRAFNSIDSAIGNMQSALDEARRRRESAGTNSIRAARDVMHSLAWGFAAASSCLEAALAAYEDEAEVAAAELAELKGSKP